MDNSIPFFCSIKILHATYMLHTTYMLQATCYILHATHMLHTSQFSVGYYMFLDCLQTVGEFLILTFEKSKLDFYIKKNTYLNTAINSIIPFLPV